MSKLAVFDHETSKFSAHSLRKVATIVASHTQTVNSELLVSAFATLVRQAPDKLAGTVFGTFSKSFKEQ